MEPFKEVDKSAVFVVVLIVDKQIFIIHPKNFSVCHLGIVWYGQQNLAEAHWQHMEVIQLEMDLSDCLFTADFLHHFYIIRNFCIFHAWQTFFPCSGGHRLSTGQTLFTLQHLKGQGGKLEWAVQDSRRRRCALSEGYLKCSEAPLQARFEGLNERLKRWAEHFSSVYRHTR